MPSDEQYVAALRNASSHSQIKRIRQHMGDETARRVIRHPDLSLLDRACLSLCLNFGQPSQFGHGEGSIIHDETDV